MNPLYTVAEIRLIEHTAAQRLPAGALMQRAGQAGANAALDLLPFSTARARVLVLAGPGNNGGDALEAAAHLAYAGAQVTILHIESSAEPSPERAHALQRARGSAAKFAEINLEAIATSEWNLLVDGLFGIGLKRPIEGQLRELVDTVNALPCSRLALDVPSGLDADTGAIVGPDGAAVRATHTVTFIGDKPGLYTCEGRDHAGVVQVSKLDLDASVYQPSRQHLNEVKFFSRHLRARRHNTHKGSYGSVAVFGGAHGMAGAPILAARAALLTGAGRVYACFAEEAPAYDTSYPELMCRHARDFNVDSAVIVAGPGLGMARAAQELLARALASREPLVLDADALNLLAGDPAQQAALAERVGGTLITPHPLEAARLLGLSAAEVQADRPAAARSLAARLHAVVVLKGSGTVLASPEGHLVINTTGNPSLATAGTGDVLAGLCGSLLAQGWPVWEAALAGVWLHGMAADVMVTDGMGPIGLTAGELIPAIRTALNRMVQHHGR
ncbi:NAD(P)H-hydrate dehydratase [Pseudoduganella sp. LjRoot289]|uniref:NAD(P)H-hydrate dehydratase n=1 Tax=Pseudoduganella sp. LjRoot289 TaxID=3342314 RepID=UPI003ECE2B9E